MQAVTDAVVLSKLVDGVILVVRADKTLREDVRRSARAIRDVGGRVVGVIVNEIERRQRLQRLLYGYYAELSSDDTKAAGQARGVDHEPAAESARGDGAAAPAASSPVRGSCWIDERRLGACSVERRRVRRRLDVVPVPPPTCGSSGNVGPCSRW